MSVPPTAGQEPTQHPPDKTGAAAELAVRALAANANQFRLLEFDTHQPLASEFQLPEHVHTISLYRRGIIQLDYANRQWLIDRPALIFCHSQQSRTDSILQPASGFHCFFTDAFLSGTSRLAFGKESPLYRLDTDPVIFPNAHELANMHRIFRRMQAEAASDYRYKADVLCLWLQLVVHQALRLRPAATLAGTSATVRLATQFLHLLEQQFPISSPSQRLSLHTAQAFAEQLCVHINHLNRAVREATGRTTSAHLAERIAREAQAMLRDTAWPIAQVAACLGFAGSSYFNRFFRKQAGISPKEFRQQTTS